MVVTRAPFTVDSGVTHERTALPFTCTVHAPHCAMPQPNFVPVSLSSSRITHSRGVLSSERAETCLPLRLNETIRASSYGAAFWRQGLCTRNRAERTWRDAAAVDWF